MLSPSRILYTLPLLALLAGPAIAQDRVESIFREARTYTVRVRTQIEHPFVEDETGAFHGAGFLVDADRGWVVTNAHVVGQSPSGVQVAFADGPFRPARKIYVDSFTDLAILQLALEGHKRPVATLDCAREPRVGEGVGVFGHPMGYDFTGTRGIISGKSDREIVDLLQTDATVEPGNSGGPVIALRDGRIVGIATSGYETSKADKVNFATPLRDVCRILDLLRKGVAPDPPQLEFALLIDEKGAYTLQVGRTFEESRWPFRPGDRIVSVGSPAEPVRTPHELVTALRGRTGIVPIRVMRDGSVVALATRPRVRPSVVARRGVMIDGALIAPLTDADSTTVRSPGQLVVHSVDSGTAADALDVEPWDYVHSIDGRPFSSLDDLVAYLDDRTKSKPLHIVLCRFSGIGGRWFNYHVRDFPGSSHELIGPESGGTTASADED